VLLQVNTELASILAPLAGNLASIHALEDYAKFKIADLYSQFEHTSPDNIATLGRIQGQIIELKALLSIQNDVRDIVKGRT
jgi:hypothetical protein